MSGKIDKRQKIIRLGVTIVLFTKTATRLL
jgi:hypothetical protein